TLSLLRFTLRKYALSPSRNGGPQARVSSPLPGCSTLITRAPMSASSIVQYGPDSTRVRSRTVMLSSGSLWSFLSRSPLKAPCDGHEIGHEAVGGRGQARSALHDGDLAEHVGVEQDRVLCAFELRERVGGRQLDELNAGADRFARSFRRRDELQPAA